MSFLLSLFPFRSSYQKGEGNIFQSCKFGQKVVELKDKANFPVSYLCQFFFTSREKIVAVKQDFPFARPIQSSQ